MAAINIFQPIETIQHKKEVAKNKYQLLSAERNDIIKQQKRTSSKCLNFFIAGLELSVNKYDRGIFDINFNLGYNLNIIYQHNWFIMEFVYKRHLINIPDCDNNQICNYLFLGGGLNKIFHCNLKKYLFFRYFKFSEYIRLLSSIGAVKLSTCSSLLGAESGQSTTCIGLRLGAMFTTIYCKIYVGANVIFATFSDHAYNLPISCLLSFGF